MDAKLQKVTVVSDKAVQLVFETSDQELLNMSIGQLKMMQEKDVTLYFHLPIYGRPDQANMFRESDDPFLKHMAYRDPKGNFYEVEEGARDSWTVFKTDPDAVKEPYAGMQGFHSRSEAQERLNNLASKLGWTHVPLRDDESEQAEPEGDQDENPAHWILRAPIAPYTDFRNEEGQRVTVHSPGGDMPWTIDKLVDAEQGIWCVVPDTVSYKTEEDARDALQTLGTEQGWPALAPDGYAAVYRAERQENDESGIEWPEEARFALLYLDENGAGGFCTRALFHNAEGKDFAEEDVSCVPGDETNPGQAQANLDEWAEKQGYPALYFISVYPAGDEVEEDGQEEGEAALSEEQIDAVLDVTTEALSGVIGDESEVDDAAEEEAAEE